MPDGYERMRDTFMMQGMKEKAAKTKAAKIWNSKHPDNPVTGKHGKKRKRLLDYKKG
uniref:Uncharacterized protein n=1 Tax=viral metagenome TaxID=1070528 RepID=A0A6H1ZQY1_9ZZZZ